MGKQFEYKITILEHHLDTFGHVNNATYLELYEQARWQFITDNGYGLKEVQERQIGPVILDIHLTFKKEITNRSEITIHSESATVEGKMMKLKQWMTNEAGEVASTLDLVIGLMDLKARKLIAPTAEWKKAIGEA